MPPARRKNRKRAPRAICSEPNGFCQTVQIPWNHPWTQLPASHPLQEEQGQLDMIVDPRPNCQAEPTQDATVEKSLEWARTGDMNKDFLYSYETGCLYDCIVKVRNEECDSYQVFKCHRLILSAASSIFHEMLNQEETPGLPACKDDEASEQEKSSKEQDGISIVNHIPSQIDKKTNSEKIVEKDSAKQLDNSIMAHAASPKVVHAKAEEDVIVSSEKSQKPSNENFPEGQMQRRFDSDIKIENTSPDVFDAVMRFVYGRETDFKDATFALKMYIFGHEWKIESLVASVGDFLKNPSPNEVFQVYDLFKKLHYATGLQECMKVIKQNTSSVLKSISWLHVSLSTVMDLLSQDQLAVEETSLLEALVSWGKKQIADENNAAVSDAQLREVIDAPLKMIRFLTMSTLDFTNLSISLKDVLTVDEKLAILTSISISTTEHYPKGFNTSTIRRDYFKKILMMDLLTNYYPSFSATNHLLFSINKNAYLLGIKFMDFFPLNKFQPEAEFQLVHENGIFICQGSTDNIDLKNNFFQFPKHALLEANTKYAVIVRYMNMQQKFASQYFASQVSQNDDFVVKLYDSCVRVGIRTLVFANL